MTDNYVVFKLFTVDTFGNSHALNRDESWTLMRDRIFNNLEEAKQYVIDKNRVHSDMVNLGFNLKDTEKDTFYDEFCFTNDKYVHKRRYFLGAPDKKKIIQNLREDNLKVIVSTNKK